MNIKLIHSLEVTNMNKIMFVIALDFFSTLHVHLVHLKIIF